jgi:hypothetical protein
MSEDPQIVLAFFLQHSLFFVNGETGELSGAPSDLSPERLEAAKARGDEVVTLRELCERYPQYRSIYEGLEKILADTGSA